MAISDFWLGLRSAAPDILVHSRELVRPSTPTPAHAFFLPYLDTLWSFGRYNRRLLFYTPPPADDADPPCQSAIVQQLKQSLSACLVQYFPWCGRLASGADPSRRLFIECNDAGVEFVEASIDLPIMSLAQDGFQMKPFFEQLCQMPDHEGDQLFSSPLLSIQVTSFSDGGFALGVAHSHIVADGLSLWNFMISWAEHSRGAPLSIRPLHDRRRVVLQEPSVEKSSLWSTTLVAREETGGVLDAGQQAENAEKEATSQSNGRVSEKEGDGGSLAAVAQPEPLVQCVLEFPSAAVEKMKSEAGEGFSSYEVICAHFWRCTTAARQLAEDADVRFAVLADCRRRLEPPLPPAYFGNVISFSAMLSTAQKICNESFGATANRIHGLVVSAQKNIMDFMHYLEVHEGSLSELRTTGVYRGQGHNVASSPRFPVYTVDFGWGKPAAVRAAKVMGEGELVFFGGRPGTSRGDVEICTALPESVLKRLFADPLFLPQLPCSQTTWKAPGGAKREDQAPSCANAYISTLILQKATVCKE